MSKNFYQQKTTVLILGHLFSVTTKVRRPKTENIPSDDTKKFYKDFLDKEIESWKIEAETIFLQNGIESLNNISPSMENSIKTLFSDVRQHLKDNFINQLNMISEELSLYQEIKSDPRFAEYHTVYEARDIKRKWTAILGPTNSGKTFHCIDSLIKAKKAIYLSPLRLMAIENQEKIESLGITCSLLTGEESDIKEGATHICCTTEMFNSFKDEYFDLVIVDEVQKIEDIDRGSAVVSALVAAKTENIYMTGPIWIKNKLQRLCKLCNDDFKLIKTERLTPLVVEHKISKLNKLSPRTIVVVFSRKNALAMKENIESFGYKVSIIYGALSPKVRREQSRRFCEGETDILVATDAIGMGLNLPADKIIFTTSTKFDGRTTRTLTSEEVKQIAGRAGRFGLSKAGLVSAIDIDSLKIIRTLIEDSTTVVSEKSLFRIKPDIEQLLKIQQFTQNDSLRDNYLMFNSIANNSDNYVSEIEKEHLNWIERIDKVFEGEPLSFKHKLSKVPFKSHAYDSTADYAIKLAQKILNNKEINLSQIRGRDRYKLEELELSSQLLDVYNHFLTDYPSLHLENSNSLRDEINERILDTLDKKNTPIKSTKEKKHNTKFRHRELRAAYN